MAKFKPGIPDTFTLNVDPVADLGDYLDEPRPTPLVAKKAREEGVPAATPVPPPEPVRPPPVQGASPALPSVPVTHAVGDQPPGSAVTAQSAVRAMAADAVPPQPFSAPPTPPPVVTSANSDPASADLGRPERGGREKAPRREISMTPETLRMSDELLDVIRSGSGQRDTKANELFHALVLLVHEVRDGIDPHAIPKRGRWGTPTARAYPLELKNAFLRALLEKYGREAGRGVLTPPVDSAA